MYYLKDTKKIEGIKTILTKEGSSINDTLINWLRTPISRFWSLSPVSKGSSDAATSSCWLQSLSLPDLIQHNYHR
ncbi:MAG: hypothetical protein SV062_07000, partial [Thermodesulfobacteriota bacterium]|nr:hypothetical protein [Thermodesulfobacteriota bacterium]